MTVMVSIKMTRLVKMKIVISGKTNEENTGEASATAPTTMAVMTGIMMMMVMT